jgi:hypothetical protein
MSASSYRVPYHVGYALALRHAKRDLNRLDHLEDEVWVMLEIMDKTQGAMERWLLGWEG